MLVLSVLHYTWEIEKWSNSWPFSTVCCTIATSVLVLVAWSLPLTTFSVATNCRHLEKRYILTCIVCSAARLSVKCSIGRIFAIQMSLPVCYIKIGTTQYGFWQVMQIIDIRSHRIWVKSLFFKMDSLYWAAGAAMALARNFSKLSTSS